MAEFAGKKVAVVGGGIAGLSTALLFARHGAEVTIIAREFYHDTTSAGAAAFWRPYFVPNTSEEDVARWSGMTMALYRQLLEAGLGETCGLHFIRGTELSAVKQPTPLWAKYAIDFEHVSPEDLRQRYGPGYADALRFTSVIADPTYLMPWFQHQLRALHARFVQAEVKDLDALRGRFDVVANCSGLGAGALAADADVLPVRGQVLKVFAPGAREWVVDMDGPRSCAYVLPRRSGICVFGGTHEDGVGESRVDPREAARIRECCEALCPEAKGAPELGRWGGLRPVRSSGVRVELDASPSPSGAQQAPLIHCYGHGGSGWTLFWGTAHDALRLALRHFGHAGAAAPGSEEVEAVAPAETDGVKEDPSKPRARL